MKNIKILRPNVSSGALDFAVNEFQRLFKAAFDRSIEVVSQLDDTSDFVVIGSDEVNSAASEYYLDAKATFSIRYGTDDYHIKSTEDNGRTILFLCGGRDRSTIFAVYRYFEKFAGCRYFWDGDIIPKSAEVPLQNIDLAESPRFEIRGIRYFAHRSLHRFQAEHWSFEDWQKEIHWMLKKRLNLFMLRIGNDDLFQKAFPEIVDYPPSEGKLPEAGADHDDRTLFWSLQYRGELRKKVLDYAFSLDLIHPEDCGTMTHWYSRTPLQYLEKVNPALLTQSTSVYSEKTGLVWDIRNDKYMQDYFKLTDAHVQHYGRGQMFHTIGLAERVYSDNREYNLRLKQLVYHKIQRYLKKKYPNVPLLLASWDFFFTYQPDEVKAVIKQLDPSQVLILDYTSDSVSESNFTNWDIVGKFPWIFGLFQGYEPNNEIRGDYKHILNRLKIAKEDASCKGMVLWPEMSHSDTFMLEFFAANAWSPFEKNLKSFVAQFCEYRYPGDAQLMLSIWDLFFPIVNMHAWSADKSVKNETDLFFCPFEYNPFGQEAETCFDKLLQTAKTQSGAAVIILELLSKISFRNEFLRRDCYDIARTICGRYITAALQLAQKQFALWQKGQAVGEDVRRTFGIILELLDTLADLLGQHTDYSLYDSLEKLKATAPVNPCFEQTLKNNASAPYCRSYIYENVRYLYLPETKLLFDWIMYNIDTNNRGEKQNKEEFLAKKAQIKEIYNNTPLSAMRPSENSSFAETVLRMKNLINGIGF
jgi:hypothetical protein